MAKYKEGIERDLHKAEIKARKVKAKHRVGTFYESVANDSKAGIRYKNIKEKSKLIKTNRIIPALDFNLGGLLRKAWSKIKSDKSK